MLNQTAVSGNRRHFQHTFTNTDTRTRKGEILQGHTHHRYIGQEHRGKRRRQHRMRKREEGPHGFAPGPRVTRPAHEEGPGAAPPDLQKCVGNAMSIFCRLSLTNLLSTGSGRAAITCPRMEAECAGCWPSFPTSDRTDRRGAGRFLSLSSGVGRTLTLPARLLSGKRASCRLCNAALRPGCDTYGCDPVGKSLTPEPQFPHRELG